MITKTFQHFTSRIVVGLDARAAAEDFVKRAKGQIDESFPISGTDREAAIDLDEWPDDEAFDGWFEEWAEEWAICVED